MDAEQHEMFDFLRRRQLEEEQAHRDELILAAHIRTALLTPSGQVLKAWLQRACFMDGPMDASEITSEAHNMRINARRDLFITLLNYEQRGIHHVSDA